MHNRSEASLNIDDITLSFTRLHLRTKISYKEEIKRFSSSLKLAWENSCIHLSSALFTTLLLFSSGSPYSLFFSLLLHVRLFLTIFPCSSSFCLIPSLTFLLSVIILFSCSYYELVSTMFIFFLLFFGSFCSSSVLFVLPILQRFFIGRILMVVGGWNRHFCVILALVSGPVLTF